MIRVLLSTLRGYVTRQPSYGTLLYSRRGTTFRAWGYFGLICSLAITGPLATHLFLSTWTILGILASAVLMFLGRVMFSRMVGRAQPLVFYRDFITVIGVASLLLWLTRQPVLPYLDVTVIGISAFVACGRVGCLMVGCCHGRPATFGICYRERNVTASFPPQFFGVRLFPVQALESFWLVCIVAVGSYQTWNHYVPGTSIGWFIVAYCPARFFLEFARWRPGNSYHRGLSEAQWTSVLLPMSLVILELAGVLALSLPHIFVALGVTAAALVVVVTTKSLAFANSSALIV
jgi:hypothetical protein